MGTSTAFRRRIRYDLDADQIRAWSADGASIREISRRLGVPFKTVHRHMVAAGIPRRERPPKKVKAADGRRHPELDAKVRELHAQGLRGEQIDAALGWKPGRAYNYQKRLGLDPRRPLPPAAQVTELYRELGTVEAVAKRLRKPERLISGILKDAGVTLRTHPLDAHLDDIRRAYLEDGESAATIAARFGYSRNTMQSFLYGRGISLYQKVTAEQHDRMVQMRAAGIPVTQIARQLGVSGSCVYVHLDATGRHAPPSLDSGTRACSAEW